MELTEINVRLMNSRKDKLRAFCSITIDNAFVIRDLKVIDGKKGAFVAMPSRKLTHRCHKCGCKNCMRSNFCNSCGAKLNLSDGIKDKDGRMKLHADIAHPITTGCRDMIQDLVLGSYKKELERSSQPGYVPKTDILEEPGLA